MEMKAAVTQPTETVVTQLSENPVTKDATRQVVHHRPAIKYARSRVGNFVLKRSTKDEQSYPRYPSHLKVLS